MYKLNPGKPPANVRVPGNSANIVPRTITHYGVAITSTIIYPKILTPSNIPENILMFGKIDEIY